LIDIRQESALNYLKWTFRDLPNGLENGCPDYRSCGKDLNRDLPNTNKDSELTITLGIICIANKKIGKSELETNRHNSIRRNSKHKYPSMLQSA
jgi:hypothetical protein